MNSFYCKEQTQKTKIRPNETVALLEADGRTAQFGSINHSNDYLQCAHWLITCQTRPSSYHLRLNTLFTQLWYCVCCSFKNNDLHEQMTEYVFSSSISAAPSCAALCCAAGPGPVTTSRLSCEHRAALLHICSSCDDVMMMSCLNRAKLWWMFPAACWVWIMKNYSSSEERRPDVCTVAPCWTLQRMQVQFSDRCSEVGGSASAHRYSESEGLHFWITPPPSQHNCACVLCVSVWTPTGAAAGFCVPLWKRQNWATRWNMSQLQVVSSEHFTFPCSSNEKLLLHVSLRSGLCLPFRSCL